MNGNLPRTQLFKVVGVSFAAALTLSLGTGLLTTQQLVAQQSTTIKIDGSSTVHPITQSIIKQFQQTPGAKSVQVSAAVSGTTAGFKKFCTGTTDINDASRPIRAAEMELCRQNRVPYIELPIGFDAVSIVVHSQNSWAKDITVAELKRIWEPAAQGKITRWQQVRPGWPNRPLKLFGPDKESGTFDYFTEAINGKTDLSRTDYIARADDEELVKGVSQEVNSLGYFGLAYVEANKDKLKALAVDNGKGPVMPTRQTVESNQYQPLSRPLFIYVNARAAQTKPELRALVNYYLENAAKTVTTVGYIPLPADGYKLASQHFTTGKVGTVFGGKAQINLTIGELLRKQAQF